MNETGSREGRGQVLFSVLSVITVIAVSGFLLVGCSSTSKQIKPAASAEHHYNRGLHYVNKHQYDLAISEYNKAIEIDSRLAIAYVSRGAAYGMKGQYDQAITDLTKAIELNPSFSEAYYNRGYAYFFKQEYNHAILEFTKAIEINPYYAHAYSMRGGAHIQSGEKAKGCDDLKRACDLGQCDNYGRLCRGWK